jgi:tetratricopeptide (TPR) repeat protein
MALFSAGIALSAGAARADDTNRVAAATILFDEGVRALDAGRLEEACQKLAKSQELAPSGGTLLALGECHERAGRIASAWVAYRGAASRAAAAGKADAEAAALEQAARLEPQLARLTITTAAGVPANVDVSRDQGPVASSELGIAIPVDPGHHEIRATAPGAKPWTKAIDVPPGASISLEVGPLEPERPPPPPPPPPSGETQHEGSTQRVLGIATAGVGAAAIATGSVFGIAAITSNAAGENHCIADGRCRQRGLDLFNQANDFATVSTVLFIAGAALVAGGAALYFTAPSPKKSSYSNPWTGTFHF